MLEGISRCGIGLRREFVVEFAEGLRAGRFRPGWVEITPENWIDMPFRVRDAFEEVMVSCRVVAHGLSLSIGSPEPVDIQHLSVIKNFLDKYGIEHYSEHLSYSTWNGSQTYELLPVPMTAPMADFIADKLKRVSDFLQRPVILENATYYYRPPAEMPEAEFINTVARKTDCPLLLDVNNVYVNSLNHGFDPRAFIDDLDIDRTAYIHTAGHTYYPQDNLFIDTHGAAVSGEVWDLLLYVMQRKPAPAMVERDNNIPPLAEIVSEYDRLLEVTAPFYEGVGVA